MLSAAAEFCERSQCMQWPQTNNFFRSFFYFWVGRYNKTLNDWPLGEYWASRGIKTHCFPCGHSLSAYYTHSLVFFVLPPLPYVTLSYSYHALYTTFYSLHFTFHPPFSHWATLHWIVTARNTIVKCVAHRVLNSPTSRFQIHMPYHSATQENVGNSWTFLSDITCLLPDSSWP